MVPISLRLSNGQLVETLVHPRDQHSWGRKPGCVYTVLKRSGITHEFVARWQVSQEGQLLFLDVETDHIPNLIADADKLHQSGVKP